VAGALTVLFLADLATPAPVFVLATIMGLVRPSDITLRNLLVGETMPAAYLMQAMGVSRTTADSARIIGALSGAGLVAALGSGVAYAAVCAVYVASLVLTFNVGVQRVRVIGKDQHGSLMRASAPGLCLRLVDARHARAHAACLPGQLRRLPAGRLAAGLRRQGRLRLGQTGPALADRLLCGRRARRLDCDIDPWRAHPAGPDHAGLRRRLVHLNLVFA
jgi:hypothetical protein